MQLQPDGSGHFTEVSLRPDMSIREAGRLAEAVELHHKAHQLCFIANSVNFPVHCTPNVKAE
jgi:organic hydroperoxide reductase OsmC/OhrA